MRLDSFGFGPGPKESQEEVIRVPDIVQAAEARVLCFLGGHPLELFLQLVCLLPVAEGLLLFLLPLDAAVGMTFLPSFSSGIFWKERLLDPLVQSVQVDVGEQGANDATLGRAAQGGVIVPLGQITCLEQVGYQPQEAVIGDLLLEDRQQHRMVDVVETSLDVPFDEPPHPAPGALDRGQRRVTTAFRSESVGVVGELRLVVSLQQ